MARTDRLNALEVNRIRAPGMYADGGGLYLQVTTTSEDQEASPAKSWIYRYKIAGRSRQMGLGSYSEFNLKEARERAAKCRQQRRDGIDPIEARKAARAQAALEAAKALTFRECARQYVAGHRAAWKNAKHAAQWESTLERYAYPIIGAVAVGAVDVGLVLKCIEPIWTKKPTTAGRVRGRIETVLDWARARGYRAGENPARLRGHLDQTLPKHSKIRRIVHHAALPYGAVGEFILQLRQQEGIAARAFELTILTAARTGEAIGARWAEIDLSLKVWTVPGERMKGGKEHRVPLSSRAIEILREMRALQPKATNTDFVFPSTRHGRPLSNMAFLMLLRRMGRADITAHGFRSTFRDWAAERTKFAREVAEMALSHAISDKVEAAYRRGDLFEHRTRLMAAWATFCGAPSSKEGNVVAIGTRAGVGRAND